MSKGAVLGEVELSAVFSETPVFSNEITDKPVEQGPNIVDHARNQPIQVSLEGIVAGSDAADKLSQLRTYARERTFLQYVGRNIFGNYILQELRTTHDTEVRDGFKFSISLRQVRLAQVQTAMFMRPNPAVTPQVKSVSNQGRQQPVTEKKDEERLKSHLLYLTDGAVDLFKKVIGG